MSDKQTHSSTKTDNTPESKHYDAGAGGVGFDEELVSQGVNIQRALSNAGDSPPDPKTVLQMQNTLGNRTTIQLVNQKYPKAKLQRKTNGAPFSGLRMIQRKDGEIDENKVKELKAVTDGEVNDQKVEEITFKDDEVDPIIGDPNAKDQKGQDQDPKEQDQKVEEITFKDDEVEPIVGDPNAKGVPENQDQKVEEITFKDDEVEPIIGDPNAKGVDDTKDDDTGAPDQKVEEITFTDDEVEPITADAKGADAKPEAKEAPKGKSGGERTGAVFKNMFNTTLGLGTFSIINAVKGFTDEVDVDQKKLLYGDDYQAWVNLERAVNIGQAVADVTASLGFITGIIGLVATVMTAGIAAPLNTIGTVLGVISGIAHILTGAMRAALAIKMATRLDEFPVGSKERAFIKGNMINTIVSAGANAVGAIFSFGGVMGWFNGIGKGITGALVKEGSSKGAKIGSGILGGVAQGMGGQLAGGTSGDIAGQISEEVNEDEVDKFQRMPLQRAADGTVLQRKDGGNIADTISAVDEKIEQIRKMKAEFKQAPSKLDEAGGKDQVKLGEYKQQLDGVQQAVPQIGKLEESKEQLNEESKKIEGKSDEVLNNLDQEKPPEPPKKKGLFSRIVSAVKSAFNKLLNIFAMVKKKILAGIAKLKAKITSVLMKVLGIDEPMETAKKGLEDKQKEIPDTIAQEEKNQKGVQDAKGMVSDSIEKLEKTEKAGMDAKQKLLEQQKQEEV